MHSGLAKTNDMTEQAGFLLTRQSSDHPSGIALTLWFYTQKGPVCIELNNQEAVFFVEQADHARALNMVGGLVHRDTLLPLKSFQQKTVYAYYFQSQQALRQAARSLKEAGIEPLEYDIRTVDRYLMERFITADVLISDKPSSDAHIASSFVSYHHPKHETQRPPAPNPDFTVVSFDIETNYRTNDLLSIAVYSAHEQKVFMLSEQEAEDGDLVYVNHEKKLLNVFLDWIEQIDPDILIGWNCINFDLRMLQQACDRAGIDFSIGRHRQAPEWRTSPNSPNHFFTLVPGRAVLDGIDTLKSATFNFESFSLEFVAQTVLNTGKLIQSDSNKAEEILRQFREDKVALAAYNLEDCRLVWDIFQACQLIDFAIERARLTGLPLDKVGGSVLAFENQYLPRLHRQGYVAPNLPTHPVGVGSPGGYVMNSKPGIYKQVLVLDFKSLYPSIIRSFMIDPFGLTEGDAALTETKARHLQSVPHDEDLTALAIDQSAYAKGFRGAIFQKEGNILSDLIAQLWHARDKAKKDKHQALSQAIKIIMNSFYGVMGTPGCRFFDRRLPSSITLRGHQIMNKTRALIEAYGYEVIYGDTDSIFVHIKQTCSHREAHQIGSTLASEINAWWTQHLHEEYQLTSYLELEFESYFSRFLMPTIRGSDKGSKKRYAGLVTAEHFDFNHPKETDYSLVFKGLETVRTDWTQLARSFQRELYRRIFLDLEYKDYIRETVAELRAGKFDEQLSFRKRLRRKLSEYQSNIPPHAQAAKKADQYHRDNGQPLRYQQGGWVRYFYTLNGPEPAENRVSLLDYDLYIERQIAPIVDSILCFFDTDFSSICSNQLKLI